MSTNVANTDSTKRTEQIQQALASPEEAVKELGKVFAANAPFHKANTPVLSGHSMGSSFVISDYMFLYRAARDLIVAAGGGQQTGPVASLSKTASAVGYQAFGMATGLNLLIGAAQVIEGRKSILRADDIGDRHGSLIGRIAVLKGISLSGAGAFYAGYRGVGIASSIKPSVGGLQTAGSILSTGGLACYAVFFVFLGAIFGIRLYEGAKLRYQINHAEDLTATKKIFEKKLTVDAEKLHGKLVKKWGTEEALNAHFIEEAMGSGRGYLKDLRSELNLPAVKDEDLDFVIYDTIEKILSNSDDKGQVYVALRKVGEEIETEKHLAKKEEKLKRILGAKGFESVQKLIKGEEMEKALAEIKGASNFKLGIDSFVLGVCIFGLALMVLSIVFTGGGALLPMLIVSLVFGLSMFAVDGYFLFDSYRNETPVKNDTRMLLLTSSVAVLAFGTVVGLSVAGIFSLGIIPLVAAVALLALWLGQNALTYYVMKRNEKKLLEKNITDVPPQHEHEHIHAFARNALARIALGGEMQ